MYKLPTIQYTYCMSRKKCPVCTTPMRAIGKQFEVKEDEAYEVGVCPRCEGVWLDKQATRAAVEGRLIAIESPESTESESTESAESAESDESILFSAPIESGGTVDYRTAAFQSLCPDCRKPLESFVLPRTDVELDSCPEHGTWFDKDELESVAEQLERERALDKREIQEMNSQVQKNLAKSVFRGLLRLAFPPRW